MRKSAAPLNIPLGPLLLVGILACDGAPEPSISPFASVAQAVDTTTNGFDIGAQVGDDGQGPHSTFFRAIRLHSPLVDKPKEAREATLPRTAYEDHATEEAIEVLARTPGNTTVSVTILLDDQPTDWTTFHGLDSAARDAFVAARRRDHESKQASLRSWLSTQGVGEFETYWLVNHLRVELPAGLAKALAARSEVRGLRVATYVGGSGRAYSGVESNDGTLMQTNFFLANPSVEGATGARSGGGRIRVGVIEWDNWINRNHVGWRDGTGTTSRLSGTRDCSSSGCPSSTTTGGNSHGTWVSWVASGDLRDGQDSAIVSIADRRQRSGSMPGRRNSTITLPAQAATASNARSTQQPPMAST